jgi:DNA-binding Lrp family transcriptional regulator
MSLDALDTEILLTLDLGSRISTSALAEKLARSQQVIEYRLRSLAKRGIVQGYYPVIDSFKLGFRYCRLFVQVADLSPSVVRSIATFASKTPQVLWCYRMNGDFNLVCGFWATSLKEFESLSARFLALKGIHTVAYNQNQVFRLDQYHITRALNRTQVRCVTIEETEHILTVDELDRGILAQLSEEARQPFSRIARVCKTSDKVVAYRIQRMEERGILRGYRPIINWDKLGLLFLKVFLRIDTAQLKLKEAVIAYLSATPELIYVVHGVGSPGEIDIEIVVPSYEGLFEYVERLRKRFPGVVKSFTHHHFTDCYKVNYFPEMR